MTSAYNLVIPASVKQGSERAQSERVLDSKFSELCETLCLCGECFPPGRCAGTLGFIFLVCQYNAVCIVT